MPGRFGLRARLVVLVAFGAVAVTTFAALALYGDLVGAVNDSITAELRLRMAALVSDIDDVATTPRRPVIAQLVDTSGEVVAPPGALAILSRAEVAEALDGELLVDRPVPGFGFDARILAQPILSQEHGRLVGVSAASTAPLDHARERLLVVLLVATPTLTAVVTLAAWVLAGAALRPVRRMASRAETISMAAPGERLPVPGGHDEIAELGRTLNAMLARIESTVARERAFVDDASHELRTPLAVLRGELELALEEGDRAAVRRGIASSLEETDRLVILAESLLTLARADAGRRPDDTAACDLTDVARSVAARLATPPGVTVTVTGSASSVAGSEEWVDRIVTNLVANAVAHARSSVHAEVSAAGDRYRLVVDDDGPGFPAELLPGAFDRFTRGDEARPRGGTGLGLAIVAALVHALGGDVRVSNDSPFGGARVVVDLPAADRRESSHRPLITPARPSDR